MRAGCGSERSDAPGVARAGACPGCVCEGIYPRRPAAREPARHGDTCRTGGSEVGRKVGENRVRTGVICEPDALSFTHRHKPLFTKHFPYFPITSSHEVAAPLRSPPDISPIRPIPPTPTDRGLATGNRGDVPHRAILFLEGVDGDRAGRRRRATRPGRGGGAMDVRAEGLPWERQPREGEGGLCGLPGVPRPRAEADLRGDADATSARRPGYLKPIERWSASWDWRGRAVAWDDHLQAERDKVDRARRRPSGSGAASRRWKKAGSSARRCGPGWRRCSPSPWRAAAGRRPARAGRGDAGGRPRGRRDARGGRGRRRDAGRRGGTT